MHDTHHPVRDTNEPREPQASADPRRWTALAAISVAQFMLILDLTVVNVALPDLGAERPSPGQSAPTGWSSAGCCCSVAGWLTSSARAR